MIVTQVVGESRLGETATFAPYPLGSIEVSGSGDHLCKTLAVVISTLSVPAAFDLPWDKTAVQPRSKVATDV